MASAANCNVRMDATRSPASRTSKCIEDEHDTERGLQQRKRRRGTVQHVAHVDRLDDRVRAPHGVDRCRQLEDPANVRPTRARMRTRRAARATRSLVRARRLVVHHRSQSKRHDDRVTDEYVTASTRNDRADPTPRSRRPRSADRTRSPTCSPHPAARWRAARARRRTRRGASAVNAGSLTRARVTPTHAPSATSCQYDVGEGQREATITAPNVSAAISARRGPNRSTGMPPSGPRNAAGQRPRERQQRDLRRVRVELVGGVAPDGDERAPAPDAVDGLAGQQRHEAAVAQGRHPGNGSNERAGARTIYVLRSARPLHRKRWCTSARTTSAGLRPGEVVALTEVAAERAQLV